MAQFFKNQMVPFSPSDLINPSDPFLRAQTCQLGLLCLVIGNPDFSLSSFPPHLFIIVFGRHFVISSVFFLNCFPGIRPLNPPLQSYHFIPCLLLSLLQSQILLVIIKLGTWVHLTQMGQACQEPICWETDWKAQETKESIRY